MGRIKTQLIKRAATKLIENHGDRFKNDFEENKKAISQLADIQSKKIRNSIAGYVTRMKNRA